MKRAAILSASWLTVSSGTRSGTYLAPRKQYSCGFFEPARLVLSGRSASPFTHGRCKDFRRRRPEREQAGSGLRARCTSRAASSVFNGAAYHRYIASRPRDASGLRVSLRAK